MQSNIAIVKFNGGRGALLCNGCRLIIVEGLVHEDKEHLCEKCGEKRNGAGNSNSSEASS